MATKPFMVLHRTKMIVKLQASSSRPGALKDAHSRLLYWAAPPRLPAAGSGFLLSRVLPPAPGRGRASCHPAPSPPRWTKVVYYFLLRVARQSRGPALPAVQSARWESPPFCRAWAATGWGSCQSTGHPARMQQEY